MRKTLHDGVKSRIIFTNINEKSNDYKVLSRTRTITKAGGAELIDCTSCLCAFLGEREVEKKKREEK